MIRLNSKQFIKQHRENWQELEELLARMKRRKAAGTDLARFDRLYQKAAQNLSFSRTFFPDEEVTFYLNDLVAKAHNLLYKSQSSSMAQLKDFFQIKFVRLLFEQWKFVVASMLLFTLGGLGSFFAVIHDPLSIHSILPAEMSGAIDPQRLGENEGAVDSAVMSASIMTNNIRVAILAFAGGITFGILTVYLMIYNGIIVGAIAGLFWSHGKSYEFWAYIVPHGMIELTAIFIAGGAGLLMGYKLLVPGKYSRGYQLKTKAKRSVQLLLGTIPLFIIAGLIEGFITPSPLPLEMKYMAAFLTVLGLLFYAWSGWLLDQKRKRLVHPLQAP